VTEVSEIGEFGLIDRIRSRRVPHDEDVVLGIGDDCAILRRGPVLEVLTTDCLVEGSHYQPGWLDMTDVGWKVIAVNVSDVAAVGGVPKHALVTLFLPEDLTVKQIDDLYDGMERCGEEMGVVVVGGDIVKINGPFGVSVTLAGVCERDEIVLRSGARQGDTIVVTGTLGDASVGLKALRDGTAGSESETMDGCIARFRRPVPRLRESRAIIEQLQPTSMIDISDGLLSDLWHIMEASGVGATLEAQEIPIGSGVIDFFGGNEEEALSQALAGGEDYELLFTIKSRFEEKLPDLAAGLGTKFTPIGKITAKGAGVRLAGQAGERELERGGFDHFGPAV
jgi:thiamine-monophosphate kinase